MIFSLVKGTPYHALCQRCGEYYWAGDIPSAVKLADNAPMYLAVDHDLAAARLHYCERCVEAIRMHETQVGQDSES